MRRGQHSLQLMCDSTPDRSQGLWSTSCSSRHVIFRGGSQMTFLVTFDVSPKAELGDRLLLRAKVSSENGVPETKDTTFQLEIPVKYAVYAVISSHDQFTKYLNFSTSEKERTSVVEHRFQVNNLGQRDMPVSINFWVPIELKGDAVWTVMVSHPQDCSIADCLHLRCDVPSLGIQDELDFILKGNLSFGWISQTLQKKVSLLSEAEITFNTSVYSQLPGQEAFLRAQVETMLEEYVVYEPIFLVAGSSVGGLLLLALITAALYKLGFFKRQYKEMLDGKPADADTASQADFNCETPPHLTS
ncbi:Integrin alpha-X [Apodemus speciosus]|uniref:Integrin alpha-X n=1 Tax=Apodemus speciosus TaxID=105296 RepID=A0ABQ0F0F4_APOSI